MQKINNELLKNCKEVATDIRKKIIKMHTKSKSSHIGSALSIVDILVVLYFHIMKINPKNPKDKNRDRFILSKGHAASALYATLARRGFFSKKLLDEYCADGSRLPGHSTKECVCGVEVSTGSLGHGLSMGVGMAVAGKYDKNNYKVFVLLSDGECNEGSVWEAAMFASHHKLDNLVVIIDYNKLQAFGRTNEVINLEPFKNKWVSFGWAAKEINGHDYQELLSTFEALPIERNKPTVIIAHTIKGKGISFMEDRLEWHYRSPTQDEYEMAARELDTL